MDFNSLVMTIENARAANEPLMLTKEQYETAKRHGLIKDDEGLAIGPVKLPLLSGVTVTWLDYVDLPKVD